MGDFSVAIGEFGKSLSEAFSAISNFIGSLLGVGASVPASTNGVLIMAVVGLLFLVVLLARALTRR